MTDKPFFPSRSRRLVGVIVLLASGILAYARWDSSEQLIASLAWAQAHRTPGDSASYASQLYHGSHGQVARDGRWRTTGYATQGLMGTLIGLALVLSARSRSLRV